VICGTCFHSPHEGGWCVIPVPDDDVGERECGCDGFVPCECNPHENTGGGHLPSCPAWEPECTCYERHPEPGCPAAAFERAKRGEA